MSILKEFIYCGVYANIEKYQHLSKLTEKEVELLCKIKKPQRDRWKNNDIIPIYVLQIFWGWKIFFQSFPPRSGIKLKEFTTKLDNFIKFSNNPSIVIDQAEYVYKDIVRFELQNDYRKMMRRK